MQRLNAAGGRAGGWHRVFDVAPQLATVEIRIHSSGGERSSPRARTRTTAPPSTCRDKVRASWRRALRPSAAGAPRTPCEPDASGDPRPQAIRCSWSADREVGLDRADPRSGGGISRTGARRLYRRFMPRRLHVLGETEISYLNALEPAERRSRLETFFGYDLPCVFVTKGQEVPTELLEPGAGTGHSADPEPAQDASSTGGSSRSWRRRLLPVPRCTARWPTSTAWGALHRQSGIGKANAYSTGRTGPPLVADDIVQVVRRGSDILLGSGHELAAHHMEIRGWAGDIPALFGIRSVRQQKRIEVWCSWKPGRRPRTPTGPGCSSWRRLSSR